MTGAHSPVDAGNSQRAMVSEGEALINTLREEMEKNSQLREKLSAKEQLVSSLEREKRDLERNLERSNQDQQHTLQMMDNFKKQKQSRMSTSDNKIRLQQPARRSQSFQVNNNLTGLGNKTEVQSDADMHSQNDDKLSIGSGFGSIGGSFKSGVPSHKVPPYKGRRATNMKINV